MTAIDFTQGFFGRLRAAAGAEWTAYVRHPFVRQLATGALPQPCFKHFLQQDYLFLIQFARAYGLAVYKSTALADIKAAAAGLDAILAELPLHVGYCASLGLSEAEMADEPEATATMTYTRYVTDIGHTGDILDLMVALMPCVAGYGEIGQLLLADPSTVIAGNPYAAWLQTYDGEDYKNSVRASLAKLDDFSHRYGGAARLADLSRIFRTATRLETAFWQMGLDAADRGP